MSRTEPETGTPEYWAQLRSEAPAVIHGESVLTYGEWDERANRVADALAGLGLKAGDRLGLRFRLGFPWFILQRALQKLDVVQVAVNWKLTPDEARYVLEDSGTRGLACDDDRPEVWAEQDLELLITSGCGGSAPGIRLEDLESAGHPRPRFGALRPALILYTSGTTGRPKGVPPLDPTGVDPDRLARYLQSVANVIPYPDKPVVLLSLPVHHGAGPSAATATCRRGGCLVLLDPFDAEQAVALIARHRVQVWTAVPTMLSRLRSLPSSTLDAHDLSSIVAINVGAAPVPMPLKRWIVDQFGPDVLWEGYGCSEAGMISYVSPADQLRKPGTSGRAHQGVEIAIVDDQWNRLAAGRTGEIAVSTPRVLKGYIGEPPLGEDVLQNGFFRTGDVGHLDEDGYLFITDRVKDMIIAGGVNIYPAEIERVLAEHPAVQDCAAIGIPHEEFGESPAVFVVPRTGASVSAEEISSFLAPRLASFKRPRHVELVDELPVNPMGKVLKNELRAPFWRGRERNV